MYRYFFWVTVVSCLLAPCIATLIVITVTLELGADTCILVFLSRKSQRGSVSMRRTFETIDTRTEEVIESITEGDKEDVDLAIKAAREAFDHGPWPRLSSKENIKELAALDALDADKLFELGKATEIPFAFSIIRRMFLMKTCPTLAAGCTMLVKPAEQSPLFALYLAHLAKLAGIPDGVINVVTGFGETVGAAISFHMDIDCVSFMGSTEIGRVVMQEVATSNLKALVLPVQSVSTAKVMDHSQEVHDSSNGESVSSFSQTRFDMAGSTG
ncbi:aldehyde dehydrogenase family 2 member C4-like protein [Tanacetum coccineum]